MLARPLRIDTRGAGVISVHGQVVDMRNKKARAILSMLALSHSNRLTRSQLKDRLWSDRSEGQAAASLRQALSALRKVLADVPDVLITTQEHVVLDIDKTEVLLPGPNETLLAGLDINDEEFEDWLRGERAAREAAQAAPAEELVEVSLPRLGERSVIGIGVLSSLSEGESKRDNIVGDMVTDLVARELRNFGIAETYDYRHRILTGDNGDSYAAGGVDFFLQVSVQCVEDLFFIGFRFFDSLDNRQLWIGFCRVRADAGYLESDEFRVFVNEIVDAALFIFSSPGFVTHSEQRECAKLALAAINETLKGRHGDLQQADIFLDRAYTTNPRSVYLGWKTHIVAYLLGERIVENPEEVRRQLAETVAVAEEQGRFNPVTLALIAHAHSFIFHDYGKALQIFDRMFQLNPIQAICFDLAAVTNVYVNNKELAYEQSQLALKLGRFSPYRYCIYTTCAMAAAINERYREAANYGELATQEKPTFTAALRYLTAAQSLAGDAEAARLSFEKLVEIEPDFNVGLLHDENYPVAPIGETGNMLTAGISRIPTARRGR